MNEHHPQNFIDAGLGSLDPSDRFDYSTIADRAFAVELSQYPAIIRASKEKAPTEVCNIGRCLADARKKLGGRFREWCEQALQEYGKSTAYSYIAIHREFDRLCPIVGQINPTTLGRLAGPQFKDLRSSVITRLNDGEILASKDVQKEMQRVRAARKAEHASTARPSNMSDDVDGRSECETSRHEHQHRLDTLVDLLVKYLPPEVQEVAVDMIEHADVRSLRGHYLVRREIVPGSY